jgi:GAF domain-containing protein
VLPAHTGVCWAAVDRQEPVVVANVHEFPGHIACDGRANSEIVLPVRDPTGTIVGVFDVDSADFDSFDQVDVENLERVLALLWR